MNEVERIDYLLPFIKSSIVKNVTGATDKGTVKYNSELVEDIKSLRISVKEIDLLLQDESFDVRTDDLIRVFYVKNDSCKFYVLIVEHLELFEGDYLAGILQINSTGSDLSIYS